jgi:ectoine hydroxylase-related dioxygenase (phytanoyl-CoA dioxygenase family)
MQVPMHQDSHYWPIVPMSTCSVWIAADKATKKNGCLAVIPGSHKNKIYKHEINDKNTTLNSGINQKILEDKNKDYITLKPGQMSLHDANLVHGSEKNNSKNRRAGIVFRYMSSDSTFNRKAKDHNQNDGHKVNYSSRPIWLIKGSMGNNSKVKNI